MNPSQFRSPAITNAATCRIARNWITFQKGESSSPRCSAKSSNMSGSWFIALMVLAFASHAVPPTWSPVDRSVYVGVTSDTATRVNDIHGGNWLTARSDLSQSSGVHYVEFHVLQADVVVGVANGAAMTNTYIGSDLNGVGYRSNGNVLRNGMWANPSPLPPAFVTGDTLGMQVDFTVHTVKFNKNGGAWSGTVDITALGSDLYVAVSLTAPATTISPLASVQILPASDWGGPVVNLVCAGDSITVGFGDKQSYCQRLAVLIQANNGAVSWARAGILGATWNYTPSGVGLAYYPYTMMQDAPIRVDPERVTDIPSWLIGAAGRNGLAVYHRTPAQECSDAGAWAAARVAAGQLASRIILHAMLPSAGVVETDRTAYNACLRTLGYTVSPLDLDPTIGCAGCNTNPAYFQLDWVHPNDAGQALIAQIDQGLIQ